MKGPGIDLGSLGGGLDISSILGTLQQAHNQRPDSSQGDEVSDIISIGSEVRDLELNAPIERKKRGRSKPKKELVL